MTGRFPVQEEMQGQYLLSSLSWPHRPVAKSTAFQAVETGSKPVGVTMQIHVIYYPEISQSNDVTDRARVKAFLTYRQAAKSVLSELKWCATAEELDIAEAAFSQQNYKAVIDAYREYTNLEHRELEM